MIEIQSSEDEVVDVTDSNDSDDLDGQETVDYEDFRGPAEGCKAAKQGHKTKEKGTTDKRELQWLKSVHEIEDSTWWDMVDDMDARNAQDTVEWALGGGRLGAGRRSTRRGESTAAKVDSPGRIRPPPLPVAPPLPLQALPRHCGGVN